MLPEALRDQLEVLTHRHGVSREGLADLKELLGHALEGSLIVEEPVTFSTISLLDDRGSTGESPVPPVPPVPRGARGLAGLPGRYEVMARLGEGGMGAVWRVRDRELGRVMALKVLHPGVMSDATRVARFVEEAQVSAQLQHPGIVPVHDLGRLLDGRFFFTMKEVQGHTLAEVIQAVHRASAGGVWRPVESPEGRSVWSFRLLVDLFGRVCEAVAYAHSRGVIHRDLKPQNIMVGAFGEVLVLDWGLAKIAGGADRPARERAREQRIQTERSDSGSQLTQAGTVAGTPAYMPPEQALGEIDALGPRSDVYALGCVLFEILAGAPPFRQANLGRLLQAVVRGDVTPLPDDRPLPEALVTICQRAMRPEASERYLDAGALAAEVSAWLEGAKARERALQIVEKSQALGPLAARRRAEAAALLVEAEALLAGVSGYEPVEKKHLGWEKQDEAAALEREAGLMAIRRVEGLQAALSHAPELPEAHAALVEIYLERHRRAEVARDEVGAARAELLLTQHRQALAAAHPTRVRASTYLKGDGVLTLLTDPPGAEVALHRYEAQRRRLVPVFQRSLGTTPLTEVTLPRGSYLLLLRAPGHREVRYPVFIERGQRWDSDPLPVWLPPEGLLGADQVYVPQGWFWSGGDPKAHQSLPRRRLWVDGLVCHRSPVTNREYITFLDDLVARGREDEALLHVPRNKAGRLSEQDAIIYGRDASGRFELVRDAEGHLWEMDYPVCMVDWQCASAYARWYSERTGARWRLPGELEWEKIARGVDGRRFPWGDFLDPTFSSMSTSQSRQELLPSVVDSFPVDTSPYGVRGMGGNMRDWCIDRHRDDGPPCPADRVPPPDLDAVGEWRVNRGGSWLDSEQGVRPASRSSCSWLLRTAYLGFRLVRSLKE